MTKPIEEVLLLLPEEERRIVSGAIAAARPDLCQPALEEARNGPGLAIVSFSPPAGIERFAEAGWVHCAGAGIDRLLAGLPFTPPLLTRTVGRMGEQIAEWVLAYILEDLQRIRIRRSLQASQDWNKDAALPRRFLFEQNVLILGTGEIGRTVAHALSALGAHVDGLSRSGRAVPPFARVFAADDLSSVPLGEYQIVVSLLPATPATRHFVGEGLLAALSRALFISAGRGETVDELAVPSALDAGRLRGAVLDVFEKEPLDSHSPLWRHPNVTVTPHVAGLTRARDTAEAFLICLEEIERGERPALCVDPERGY